jgi:hypothetical protein
MLMVIGMGLLRVGAVERRLAPPLHNLLPDVSAQPFSSPPPSPREGGKKEIKKSS